MKRLILFLVVLGFSYNASANPINTGAEIITSITVPEQTLFDIDQFAVGVSGGVINFDTDETIPSFPEITFVSGDPGGVARWISASAPALATITVTVTVTGTTLDSGADATVIVSHCRGPGGALDAENGNCPLSSKKVVDDDATMGDKILQYDPQADGF